MSEAEHAEHGSATVSSPFTEAEVAAFREEDQKAARNFVGLMLGIFVSGVILYLVVAYVCAT